MMNNRNRLALGIAGGAASGAALGFLLLPPFYKALNESPAEIRANMDKCVSVLGAVGVDKTVLPSGCRNDDSRQYILSFKKPVLASDDSGNHTAVTFYALPPKSELAKHEQTSVNDQEAADADSVRLDITLGALGGAAAGAAGAIKLLTRRLEPTD